MNSSNKNVFSGSLIHVLDFSTEHMDCEEYHGWLRDADVVRTLNLPKYLKKPISDFAIKQYCKKIMKSKHNRFFAIHQIDTGKFIGTCKIGSIDNYSCTADLGIMIGRKDLWGSGYATESVSLLCHIAFDLLKMRRLTAGSMSNNPGMIRVFKKLGFKVEGILRQHDRTEHGYVDHISLGCLKHEFKSLIGRKK